MPRPRGDHDARRQDVARAVLCALGERGFANLTMRAVAAELGSSTGVLTHYFASKDELQVFALKALLDTVDQRARAVAAPGMPTLRALLLGMLPLTGEAAVANRIWISSRDVVLADAQLTAAYAATYAHSRDRLEGAIRSAQAAGELDDVEPAELAAGLHAVALGVSVQAVLEPAAFPPERQIALIDTYLQHLAP